MNGKLMEMIDIYDKGYDGKKNMGMLEREDGG